MKSWRSRKIFFAALLVAVILAGIVFKRSSSKPPASSGTTGVVKKRNLQQRVTITGQIWPRKRLDIRPAFKGYVTKLYVKIGDHVKTHDPIITFSPSLSNEETNFPVRAAFDGIVTQVLKGEGEYVADSGDGSLAVRIEDITTLDVIAAVPELDIAKVKNGQEALIRVSALPGESFKGDIIEIGLSARDKDRWSSSSTEYQIRVRVKSKDPRLYPGLSAVMDVITDKRDNILALEHEFLQEDEQGYFVTTAAGEIKRAKVGMQTDEAVEIVDGLKEGENVKALDFLSLPKLAE